MLHAMPLIWCGVLLVLFMAYLVAEVRYPVAGTTVICALALSIAGARPWVQTAFLGVCWLLLRLILFLRKNDQPDDETPFG